MEAITALAIAGIEGETPQSLLIRIGARKIWLSKRLIEDSVPGALVVKPWVRDWVMEKVKGERQ